MPWHKGQQALELGTISTGFGGAILAQATQSTEITAGAIILSSLGLAGLIARGYFDLAKTKYDYSKLGTELEVYRRLCRGQGKCPFSADGTPECAITTRVGELPDIDATSENKSETIH